MSLERLDEYAQTMIEYEDLKLFYSLLVDVVFDPMHIAGEASPVRVLEKIEEENRSMAKRSLRMGISDAMTMLRDESPEAVSEFSERLASAGAPSIAMVRAHLSKRWNAIVEQGAIATDEQFYLVRELLDAPDIPEKDRLKLVGMLDAYEANRRN
jgi:polyhydroxyalkanoate synthesis regulator phasin